jgi:hypothetical protein
VPHRASALLKSVGILEKLVGIHQLLRTDRIAQVPTGTIEIETIPLSVLLLLAQFLELLVRHDWDHTGAYFKILTAMRAGEADQSDCA